MEHSADLLAVLRASGAGGGAPGELETLVLLRCHLAEHALAPAAGGEGEAQRLALEGVNHLQLQDCPGQVEGMGAEAALRVLLPQLPCLASLSLEDCELEAAELPGLLHQAPLTSLALVGCGLEQLPHCQGLAGEHRGGGAGRWRGGGAGQMGRKQAAKHGLQRAADHAAPAAVPVCLPATLPLPLAPPAGLAHLSLSDNSLQSLPPALAAATALTALDISDNPRLALDMWGVYTLAALPRLQRLAAWGTATPSPVWRAAQEAMPRLRVVSQVPSVSGESSSSEEDSEEDSEADSEEDSEAEDYSEEDYSEGESWEDE